MRVIGVLDLRRGRAVHARGGARDRYAPVRMVAGVHIHPGDPVALARAYVDRLGLTELYAADLDAIGGEAPQHDAVATLAALRAPLCVDAGVSTVDRATQLVAMGVAQVVVGLETLPSWNALKTICEACDGHHVVFSLDLREGQPVAAAGGVPPSELPEDYAARAADTGIGAIIVLDLARVGTGAGLDLDIVARIRRTVPDLALLAGGGIHDVVDLARLADAGCDGALVATALHAGWLSGADVAAAARLHVKSQVTRSTSQPECRDS
jgi:phosphoribosylformimino-5-aminoimidazole carboxamide ribotide isomerase